jgi:ArsR family transcriptional regulator
MTERLLSQATTDGPLERADAERVTAVIAAIANPARLRILSFLAGATEPLSVMDFPNVLGLNQSTVSHHMRILSEAGLVDVARAGVYSRITLNRERFEELREFFDLYLVAKPKRFRRS